eukprot:CAMPEP_0171485944 /NCGR_PEP_ID=MMETSP0958-20121227/818_1 /TAXON_ID=87120 /ORGANISM="Aurantiochytrium limacinum, Strain ATCCMYA-1381" /LENGTH=195 /DNA_ID=CAMNT_0012018773 /DNA_START=70 /DNA_END=657 /DNA_ORIENTATION=+
MESIPFGAILVALTMVSFVRLRKAGKAHLLMPHQLSIGIASGWTALASVAAAMGFHPEAGPQDQMHLLLVFLPQQFLYALSLWTRNEIVFAELGLTTTALGSTLAVIFLQDSGLAEAYEFGAVICAALLAFTLLPKLNMRLKVMFILWGLILGTVLVTGKPTVPMVMMLIIEELSLLNVKIQYLGDEEGARKRAE